MVCALIFAGGHGTRMRSEMPKQFIEVQNKPILVHTLNVFENSQIIDKIVVVTLKEYIDQVLQYAEEFNITKIAAVIPGGLTAMDSQFNGLEYLMENSEKEDIVFIHDGVRPFINSELLEDCLKCTIQNRNAITVSPATETISILNEQHNIKEIFRRQSCVLARAPQVFYLSDIYNAHIKAASHKNDYVDSASLMMSLGNKLNVIEGPVENIKITTQYDLALCKLWMKEKYEND